MQNYQLIEIEKKITFFESSTEKIILCNDME